MDEISRNTTEVIMQVHNLFRSRISAITAAKDSDRYISNATEKISLYYRCNEGIMNSLLKRIAYTSLFVVELMYIESWNILFLHIP